MPMIYDPSGRPELQEEQDLVIRALEQYCTDNQVSADEAATRKGSEVQQAARATIAAKRALLQQEQQEQEEEEDARGKAEEEELKEAARQKKETDIEVMLATGPLADTVRVLHTQRRFSCLARLTSQASPARTLPLSFKSCSRTQ